MSEQILLPAEPGGPAPYVPKWRRTVGYTMTGAGGALAFDQLAGGLPHNGDDWILFGLKALAAIIGLLIGGR